MVGGVPSHARPAHGQLMREKAATANFLLRSAGALVPLLLGIASGQPRLGLAAFLGSYLLLCAFPDLDSRPHLSRLLPGGLLLGLAATSGALLFATPAFALGLLVFAGVQAMAHIVDRGLQLAAAMACLSYLLAPIAVSAANGASLPFSVFFVLGVAWHGLLLCVPLSRPASSQPYTMLPMRTALARQEWFVFSLGLTAVLTLAACTGIAALVGETRGLDPVELSLWAVAASLRIPVSDGRQLRRRSWQRSIGAVIGSAVVWLLILAVISEPEIIVCMLIVLMLMQVIGAGRYLSWSTGLTIIAVFATFDRGSSLEADALARVLATGLGAAFAVGLDGIYRVLGLGRPGS